MSESNQQSMRFSGNEGEAFAEQNLVQIKVDDVNWRVLWKNPKTGDFWKEFFPQSGLQGGGPPEFVRITAEEATKEFGLIE